MRSMVPPDFRSTGRNLSSGIMRNLSLAKNFAITTATTAKGPSAFFIRLRQSMPDGDGAGVSKGALPGEFSTSTTLAGFAIRQAARVDRIEFHLARRFPQRIISLGYLPTLPGES